MDTGWPVLEQPVFHPDAPGGGSPGDHQHRHTPNTPAGGDGNGSADTPAVPEAAVPAATVPEATGWLDIRGMSKVYPDGTRALHEVDFSVRKGEIHGLLGENGAGKTTLMKILAGILPHSGGTIYLGGQDAAIRNTADALAAGIGMVHQHFSLVGNFTALNNILLGAGPLLATPRRAAARNRMQKLMEETGLNVPLDTDVENLPVGVQQRVEILKILDRNVDLLILDEPTAVLTPRETDQLFKVLKGLAQGGTTVVFITHKLREVLALTDRVTVLRGGRLVGVASTADVTAPDLARMMVGSESLPAVERSDTSARERQPILTVTDLQVQDDAGHEAVKGVSFTTHAGEIFAVAGVEGNGQSELIEALTGLRRPAGGTAELLGKSMTTLSPRQLYRLGLGHVPEDRHRLGMVAAFTVMENSVLGVHLESRFRRWLLFLDWGKVKTYARDLVARFQVVTPSLKTPMRSLSGGNQQKLVVGRELGKDPALMVAAQPTRGLDVKAAAAIRDLLVEMRARDKAILLVSADLDEVLALADRIGVLYEGRFLAVLDREEFDREQIGLLMGGVGHAASTA